MTLNHLEGQSKLLSDKIQAFSQKLVCQQFELREKEINTTINKYSYYVVNKETQQPFALLKSNPEVSLSIHAELLPHLTQNPAPGWEHELIGYELDQLLGFDHTPLTFTARILNKNNEPVNGVLQEVVPNSKSGDMLHNSVGAKLLKEIPYSHVHTCVFSGIFKGLSAGHIGNYLFQFEGESRMKTLNQLLKLILRRCCHFAIN